MMQWWPHWLRWEWLYILPLLLWLAWRWWLRPVQGGVWQRIVPEYLHSALLGAEARTNRRLTWWAVCLGWLLAILALLGPSWQQIEVQPLERTDPLVLVLDLSQDMLTPDLQPNRLEWVRRKVLDLLQVRAQAPTAVVVYAGSAHTLVPLSDDQLTTRNLLDVLQPSIMPTAGQRADLGIAQAVALLTQAGQSSGRIVLITARLSQTEVQGIHQALAQQKYTLDVLGVGTTQGLPIPQPDGSFVKDNQGAIVLSRLEEPELQALARVGGGAYRRLSMDDADLSGLGLLDKAPSAEQTHEASRLAQWADLGHWLLLPLLLLAACAGRRGWLLGVAFLCTLPDTSQAFEWMDLWRTPDQQGAYFLEHQQPDKAATHFADQQWQAMALYAHGDYNAAAQRFNQGDSAINHYNRGTALARNGDLKAALDAYDSALARQPDLVQAQTNRALVAALLAQQEQQKQAQQQPPQDQKSEQQSEQESEPPQGQNQSGSGGASQDSGQKAANGQSQTNASPQPKDNPADSGASAGAGADHSPPTPVAPKKDPDGTAAAQPQTQGAEQPTDPAQDTQAQRMPAAGANSSGENMSAQANSATQADRPGTEGTGSAEGSEATRPEDSLNQEQRQALEQWLRQIPDNPSELLRRKFWYQQQQRQEMTP